MEEERKNVPVRPEGDAPADSTNLWTGGSWEHPEEGFPPIPPVVIPAPPMEPRRRRKKHKKRRIPWFAVVIAVIFAVALGVAALHGSVFQSPEDPGEPDHYVNHSTEPPDIDRAETGSGLTVTLNRPGNKPLTTAQIYEKNLPSVVSVESLVEDGVGAGTGIVLSEDGYILTNAHVVAGGQGVIVTLSDNQVHKAELVGFQNDEDLAVLKIDAEGLTPAEFGDSAALRPGEPVAAMGDPLGYRATITGGVVSGLDRSLDTERGEMIMIQTSASINHGNSGGPLLNQYGQVVGVTTIKIVSDDGSSEAMGFAIPTRRVKYVADRLIAGEPVELAVFGFTIMTMPEPEGGLTVISVSENSDCYKKGLREGDVILSAKGRTVSSSEDLAAIKLDMGPGETLPLTYRRDGKEHTIEVALVSRDDVK